MTLIMELGTKKRKELRADLSKLLELRKAERQNVYELYLKPLDDVIDRIKRTLKNDYHIQNLQKFNNYVNEYNKKARGW